MAEEEKKIYNPKDIQANVLRFHNRRHGVYLFLNFKDGERAHVRKYLSEAVSEYVTSAEQQTTFAAPLHEYEKQLDAHRKALKKGQSSKAPRWPDTKCVVTFGLSYKGYEYLGLVDYLPNEEDVPLNKAEDVRLDLAWFKSSLGTPPQDDGYQLRWNPEKQNWHPEYRNFDIHAIFIIADDDYRRLQTTARELKRKLGPGVRVLAHEETRRLVWQFHDSREPKEHFGFRDGINRGPDPDDVLVKEPQLPALVGLDKANSYGSFLAVLKLEQDVQKFRHESEQLAAQLRSGGSAADISGSEAEALAVGRKADGTPLVVLKDPHGPDDFDFSSDPNGLKCPVHSHIRKMNSRGENTNTGVERYSKILRRGMSYGPEREDLLQGIDQVAPSSGVGLMFTSFQENVVDFVSLFHRAYNPKELDALIGRTRGQEKEVEPQTWVKNGSIARYLMADFVTPKGGEYFFVPGMRLILNMGKLFPPG